MTTIRQEGQEPRILILGCSAAKRPAQGAVPARDLYDGPAFRVFRRRPGGVRLLVLSGRHGLISGRQPVEPYDAPLGDDEALGRRVAGQFADLLGDARGEALAVMGGRYLRLLRIAWSGTEVGLRALEGPPGVRLSGLRRWLDEGTMPEPERTPEPTPTLPSPKGEAVAFRGRAVVFSRADVEAAVAGETDFGRPAAWAVDVGGRLVPPKWLLARLTGVRAGGFHTHEALRVLRGLGFEAREVGA